MAGAPLIGKRHPHLGVANWNDKPKPSVWTKTTEQIHPTINETN
jgi:hypothetical protein